MTDRSRYILGVSQPEMDRLALQAEILAPFTRRALLDSGVRPGGSLLDVGTGTGDIALMAAEIVGPDGRVHGVDIEAGMIEAATASARDRGLRQATFALVPSGPSEGPGPQFDVVAARFVLSQQRDQGDFLRRLARRVRPGGSLLVIDFANFGRDGWSLPVQPRYDDLVRRVFRVSQALGHDHLTGARFPALFAEAALPRPTVVAELLVGAPESKVLDYAFLCMRQVLPRESVQDGGAVDPSRLDALLTEVRGEIAAASAQIAFQCVSAAWASLAHR